ncbi:MAG TPA: hypothetical protein VIL48_19985 [Acidimicrobiales bacterium]
MTLPEVVPITAADDGFHPVSDHPYETETFWASFHVPERAMGGWFYNQVQFNQGVCHGGAWVWDASPAGARYEVHRRGLPLPDPDTLDLRDVRLPTGNHLQALEPLRRYRVRYSDPGRFEADVTLEALRPPHSHPLGVAPFWKGRHFDQAMHVTGQVVLDGEVIDVDSLSVRDRSWGPRPGPAPGGGSASGAGADSGTGARRRRPPPEPAAAARPPYSPFGVGYVFGTASADDMFLAYTLPCIADGGGRDDVTTGYLVRDGIYGLLVEGRRRAELDPERGWMRRIVLEAVDQHGRELTAVGTLVSHHGERGLGTGYFRWEWDGAEGYGEDQSFAPEAVVRALGEAGLWTGV